MYVEIISICSKGLISNSKQGGADALSSVMVLKIYKIFTTDKSISTGKSFVPLMHNWIS